MLRIALIGDLHYFRIADGQPAADELIVGRKLFYETYMRAFLGYEADLHISVGDFTHGGHPEEFEDLLAWVRASGVRFRMALGNHDVQSMAKTEVAAYTGTTAYEALSMEEADLIFLDTAKEMRHDDWGGEVDAEQLAWLEEQIVRSSDKPVLVFAHHPVWDTTAGSREKWFNINPETDIQSILRKKVGMGVYFNGHNHVHSIVRSDQWYHVQTAASLCYPSFRILEIDNGQLFVRDIEIDHEDVVRGLSILKDKFTSFYYVEREKAQGLESDRDRLIELY